jgi:hypothetical protein
MPTRLLMSLLILMAMLIRCLAFRYSAQLKGLRLPDTGADAPNQEVKASIDR